MTVHSLVHNFFTLIIDAVFPPTCGGCGIEGTWLCTVCQLRFTGVVDRCFGCRRPSPDGRFCFLCRDAWPIDGITATGVYIEPAVRNIIHTFKYTGARMLVRALAPLLARAIEPHLEQCMRPVLVPIPLARQRLAERGFNQAELLARAVGTLRTLPDQSALVRTRNTDSQTELTHMERKQNVIDAFEVIDRACVVGNDVILIDDVATTGATLRAAATVLRAAGAKSVWASVIALG